MKRKSMTVALPEGLEARKIAELVQIAVGYDSRVYIEAGSKKVNAKSIMGMMSLQLHQGDELAVEADGVDEEAVVADMERLIGAA